MPCHLTLCSEEARPPVSELGGLYYRGLSGQKSRRSCRELRTRNKTAVDCSRVDLTATHGRREGAALHGVERRSRVRGATPGYGTKSHGGAGEPELVKFDELVEAVRLGDAPGTEDGARNSDFRVPGQFRRRGKRLDGRLPTCSFDRRNEAPDKWMIW
jgi:hypothetical protein